jgi:nicotinamidase-related amidase
MAVVPAEERAIFEKAGFMTDLRIGEKVALIVVDVTYGFTGCPGKTLNEAIAEHPSACGPKSWEAMPRIAALISLFRKKEYPIVFTRSDSYGSNFAGKATKRKRSPSQPPRHGHDQFPKEITPLESEWVLAKTKPSAFFQTPLISYFVREGIDTVFICGVSTSGCVRATAVDACSHGLTTFVADDCCFDRSEFAHCASLFDLNAKYASVLSQDEITDLLDQAGHA